jgi:hypothetical protein
MHAFKAQDLDIAVRGFPFLGLPLEMRTCDEIVNAHSRIGGLEAALEALKLVSLARRPRSRPQSIAKRPLLPSAAAAPMARAISISALTNLFIYFDRTWRYPNPERQFLKHISNGRDMSGLLRDHAAVLAQQLLLDSDMVQLLGTDDNAADGASTLREERETVSVTQLAPWCTLCGAFLCANLSVDAIGILDTASKVLDSNLSRSALVELCTFSSVGQGFPLLTSSAEKAFLLVTSQLEALDIELHSRNSSGTPISISSLLLSVPTRFLLAKKDSRLSASMSSLVDMIEASTEIEMRPSFLECLFNELVSRKLLVQAARILKHLDVVKLLPVSSRSYRQMNLMTTDEMKLHLSRKWLAILLKSSLSKKSSALTQALKMKFIGVDNEDENI